MNAKKFKPTKGFTLIEILLVLVIVSFIIFMGVAFVQQRTFSMRIDRTTTQMQQILNAALSFYVANGSWPNNIGELISQGYLPSTVVSSPWGGTYAVSQGPVNASGIAPLIYVYTPVRAGASTTSAANIIAGSLPLGFATSDTRVPPVVVTPCAANAATCNVVGAANVPGQNLNNASAVNFASVYHNGACVPAPACPVDVKRGTTLTPEIIVAPVSVSGTSDPNSTAVYPINSFTAYVTTATPVAQPKACDTNPSSSTVCYKSPGVPFKPDEGTFWRVCLEVVTQKGIVSWGNQTNNSGEYATILAITRCSIKNEPSGSSFQVYTP